MTKPTLKVLIRQRPQAAPIDDRVSHIIAIASLTPTIMADHTEMVEEEDRVNLSLKAEDEGVTAGADAVVVVPKGGVSLRVMALTRAPTVMKVHNQFGLGIGARCRLHPWLFREQLANTLMEHRTKTVPPLQCLQSTPTIPQIKHRGLSPKYTSIHISNPQ
jgi:hypothetical protein